MSRPLSVQHLHTYQHTLPHVNSEQPHKALISITFGLQIQKKGTKSLVSLFENVLLFVRSLLPGCVVFDDIAWF